MKVMARSFTPALRRPRTSLYALVVVVLLGGRVVGHAQGTVGFQNSLSTLIYTNSAPGGPPTGIMSGPFGTSYYFAMLAAPYGTTNLGGFSFTGGYASNYFVDGGLSGPVVAISNTQPGQLEAVVVWGWSANIGPNFSDVQGYLANPTFSAWFGQSLIATVTLGDDLAGPQIPFGPFPGQVPGFVLDEHLAVPEPTSRSLLLLAAGFTGLSCRKKSQAGAKCRKCSSGR